MMWSGPQGNQALLMVIPLLQMTNPALTLFMQLLRWVSSRTDAEPSEDGMADLETIAFRQASASV
jgi:hypothetical protein